MTETGRTVTDGSAFAPLVGSLATLFLLLVPFVANPAGGMDFGNPYYAFGVATLALVALASLALSVLR